MLQTRKERVRAAVCVVDVAPTCLGHFDLTPQHLPPLLSLRCKHRGVQRLDGRRASMDVERAAAAVRAMRVAERASGSCTLLQRIDGPRIARRHFDARESRSRGLPMTPAALRPLRPQAASNSAAAAVPGERPRLGRAAARLPARAAMPWSPSRAGGACCSSPARDLLHPDPPSHPAHPSTACSSRSVLILAHPSPLCCRTALSASLHLPLRSSLPTPESRPSRRA
jgi:hypothetical protein